MTGLTASARAVRWFRFCRQELDREPAGSGEERDVALLDYGLQDTGPDGAAWALAVRGAAPGDLAYAWTIRGAPHAYRRGDLAAIAVATAPFSEADAGKRMFDAVKPLKEAGIPALEALRTLAGHLRHIVRTPTVKGEVSRRLTSLVDQPFLRPCRPCDAIHVYENPFRLAALQGGLELEPGTSPPVLRRIPELPAPMYRRLGGEAHARFDVVRNYVRFYGPATVRDAAEFLDAPVREVERQWPDDAVEVVVDAAPSSSARSPSRFVLADDVEALVEAGTHRRRAAGPVRLLGPYDPFLQSRDRDVLVPEPARRRVLWPVLGRPGVVVSAGEIIAVWRPKAAGKRLRLTVETWKSFTKPEHAGLEDQAERLAAHRGVALAGLVID